MKQLLIILLFISTNLNAQKFAKVDELVRNYPRFSKVEALAKKIEKDFTKDIDKARATFFWLTQNIRYNLKELYNPRKKRSYRFKFSSEEDRLQKIQAIKDQFVAKAFRTKMGVCEEYAQAFKKVCDLLGIEAAVLKGNVRNEAREIGTISRGTNHAWNAVKINEKWLILDATWAAGYEYNGKWIRRFNGYFFDIPKDKMFKTHYPKDKLWVLRFGRMSLEEFYNQPIYTNTFLGLQTELLLPKKGTISLKSSENILLKFKNLDSNAIIFYAMSGNKYAQKPLITTANKISTISIKNPKRNADLVLYINQKDALHFKVRVR
ncbi:transglutaminase domain-containing protein [Polaribacter porphyrae]|uniref:Transglutaminase n=1 Tax=Polaribacter porphyrae TaxID=1137780 RepID=A0A2S7WNQ7_9FLAO|nr:transglutaminase domain-containing protein [Polaribacter porphyrae]PQJ79245.1 transglutaminase [Polaribacter porphyrae]